MAGPLIGAFSVDIQNQFLFTIREPQGLFFLFRLVDVTLYHQLFPFS